MEEKNILPRNKIKHQWYRRVIASVVLALIVQFVAIRLELSVVTLPPIPTNLDSTSFLGLSTDAPEGIDMWIPTVGSEIVQATGGLTITKIANPAHPLSVNQGELITYTLIISNNTGDDLENILVTDTVPLNTDCSSLGNVSGWLSSLALCEDDRLALWYSANDTVLTNNDSVELSYAVLVNSPLAYPSVITNDNYSVAAEQVGGVATYDDYPGAPITTSVNSPAWEIQKTVEPNDTVPAGEFLTYTIIVTNVGSMRTAGPYIISDTIPSNTSLSNNPHGGNINGDEISWTIPATDLSQNQKIQVQYSVQVDSPLSNGLDIVNQMYMVYGGGAVGPVYGKPVTVTVTASPNLSIIKTSHQSSVKPGDLITYTIIYSNAGNAISGDFVISDTLPMDTSYVSGTTPDNNVDGRMFGWIGSNLSPSDGPQEITMVVKASDSLSHNALLTNSVTISSTDGSFDSATNVVTILASPDLIIHKSDSTAGAPVQAGELITYTIAYTNVGTAVLTTLRMTDTLPASVTVESVDLGTATQESANPLIFNQATLAAGERGLITLTARLDETPWPSTGLSFTNTVVASFDGSDVNDNDNIAQVTTLAQPALPSNLVLSAPVQASVGVTVPITATVTDAFGNPVLDGTPISFVVDSPGILDAPLTQTSNGLAVVGLRVISPTAVDVMASYNAISDTQTIAFVRPNLMASKQGTPNPVDLEDQIVYTIVVTNTGSVPAEDVVVTDTLPSELTFISASAPVTVSGREYRFALGTLTSDSNNVYTLVLTTAVSAAPNQGDIITNTVSIDAIGLQSPVMASDAVTVILPAFTKAVIPNPILAGDTITYTILYRNIGDKLVSNLRITDTLPAELETITFIDLGDTTLIDQTTSSVIVSQNSLGVGHTTAITVVGTIITGPWSAAPTPLLNTASATHDDQLTPLTTTATAFVHPQATDHITLEASSTMNAIGSSPIITASMTDQYGNPILNSTPVTFTSSLPGSGVSSIGQTQNGYVTATVTSSISGTTTIMVEVDGRNTSTDLIFTKPDLLNLPKQIYLPILLRRASQ